MDHTMNRKDTFYPEARFGGFTDIDGTVAFFNRVNSLIESSSVVLDVGCGRGALSEDPILLRRNLQILQGKAAKVIGIDVDRGAQSNPFLDEFRLIQAESWPVDTSSIDLIISDCVLEHIENPKQFFVEVRRVLRDGGLLCIRTPNRWSYIALAATIIPGRYHSKVLSVAQDSRKEEDVFPTFYRCNSIRKLRSVMRTSGFEAVVYGYEAEPSYLSFSKIAYYFGVLHQRFSPGFLKPAIFAFGKIRKDVPLAN
jgi:SAM-dependent methyltransferase